MLFETFRKIMPKKFGRFIIDFLDKKFLDKESPVIPLWLFFMYGVRLKQIKKNLYLARGFGEKMLMPQGAWRVFLEIFHENPYEQVFRVEKDDVVIDVGAHVGFFMVKAGKAVGKNGLVVAIEPEPDNVVFLSKNAKATGFNNVVILKKAAGARKEKAKLYLRGGTGRSHSLIRQESNFIEVEVDTLDNIISKLGLKKVNFVKIDVEGVELEVLKGADRLLNMPNVKLAIGAYHVSPDGSPEFKKILSYLKSKNVKVWANELGYIYAKT